LSWHDVIPNNKIIAKTVRDERDLEEKVEIKK
jgi:hypothetical protein